MRSGVLPGHARVRSRREQAAAARELRIAAQGHHPERLVFLILPKGFCGKLRSLFTRRLGCDGVFDTLIEGSAEDSALGNYAILGSCVEGLLVEAVAGERFRRGFVDCGRQRCACTHVYAQGNTASIFMHKATPSLCAVQLAEDALSKVQEAHSV